MRSAFFRDIGEETRRERKGERNAREFIAFKGWFWAAAVYNLVWGVVTLLVPHGYFRITELVEPNYPILWQCLGMFVLVFAPAYAWAARDPFRFRHMILIGFLGKLCGPIGFVWSVWTGALPLGFGWTILTNDVVWLPAFYLFLGKAAARCGGWMELVRGE